MVDTSDTGTQQSTSLLIFDGDCAFCTSSATWLAERLSKHDGRDPKLVPYQFADLPSYGLTPRRAQREALWVTPDGTVYGGAQVFAAWMIHRGGPLAVLGHLARLPVIRHVLAGIYRLIANNRTRMPGGTPACALPPPGSTPPEPGH